LDAAGQAAVIGSGADAAQAKTIAAALQPNDVGNPANNGWYGDNILVTAQAILEAALGIDAASRNKVGQALIASAYDKFGAVGGNVGQGAWKLVDSFIQSDSGAFASNNGQVSWDVAKLIYAAATGFQAGNDPAVGSDAEKVRAALWAAGSTYNYGAGAAQAPWDGADATSLNHNPNP
jgi:hypothetical protein